MKSNIHKIFIQRWKIGNKSSHAKLFSYKDDVVLDPFNGAGTTTFVANKLGRKYIGIDMSETYCAMAENRIAKFNPLAKFYTTKNWYQNWLLPWRNW